MFYIAIIGLIIFNIILVIYNIIQNKKYTSFTIDYGSIIREEFRIGRAETSREYAILREEIDRRQKESLDSLLKGLSSLGSEQQTRLESLMRASRELETAQKEELQKIKNDLNEHYKLNVDNQNKLFTDVKNKLDTLLSSNRDEIRLLRDSLEARFKEIQAGNEKKLEEMRITVDEKLHNTLEKRLGESFKIVSSQLEAVQKGLGEMTSLANGVGDLKRVLTNVKTRGTWGEMQLEAILEQLLTSDQYEKNVKVKKSSSESVEFAIKLPGRDVGEKNIVWLPIDSKFPKESYERLIESSQNGDLDGVKTYQASLIKDIQKCANDINKKYIEPPATTNFAIMFLPTEGLYAEVLREPGLHDKLQQEYRVMPAGPTTLSAILNSLRVGFNTLAIEKRSGEVWQVLSAVKTEFGKFGDVLDKVQQQLSTASNTIDQTKVRTRAIEKKLKNVENIPIEQADSILQISDNSNKDEDVE